MIVNLIKYIIKSSRYIYTLLSKDFKGVFPIVLGYKGAGIVESVGKGVISVKSGDNIVAL